MKKLLLGIIIPMFMNGQVGVQTSTPQRTLHVNGSLQITNELNVGGDASNAGIAGGIDDVLVSNGAGVAPSWRPLSMVSGTVSAVYYIQGTSSLVVNQGVTSDVPGVSYTLVVPAGKTQTFLFSILGYAVRSVTASGQATQGVFSLLQNGVKVSSAYVSSGDGGSLVNLPSPVTFLKSIVLTEGTYTFKVQYSAWSGNQTVNFVPSSFAGYNGDTESMLTKMQIMVRND